MIATDKTPDPACLDRLRAQWFRIAGLIILLVGVVTSGIVYWRGTHAPAFPDDPAMIGFDRTARRQSGVLYGKFGEMSEDLSNQLQQPGTQAFLIAFVSVTIASGCFYFARLLRR